MTDIYIISGFLGAGKTTFIQNLLKQTLQNEKVVIIENDFGEVNFDASLLSQCGYEVKALNSGCICCSIYENFVESLVDIVKQFQPNKIIIEPSGVSKLSDVEKACAKAQNIEPMQLVQKLTIVDVSQFQIYVNNFGEFFEDQIKHADQIFLSKVSEHQEHTKYVEQQLKNYNCCADICSKPFEDIDYDIVLASSSSVKCHCSHQEHAHTHCNCHHHEHHHTANDSFQTFTIRFKNNMSQKKMQEFIVSLEKLKDICILRAKGIIQEGNHYLKVQSTPNQLSFEKTELKGNYICLIGTNVDDEKIKHTIESILC